MTATTMANAASTKSRSRRLLTVSNRLAILGAIGISIAFLFAVWIQIDRAQSVLLDSQLQRNVHITEVLADQIYGPLRWRKPSIISKTYDKLVDHMGGDVSAIITLDRNDTLMASYQRDPEMALNLPAAAQRAAGGSSSGLVTSETIGHWFVVVTPILFKDRQDRLGTLAIAWDLSSLYDKIDSMAARAATTAALMLITISTLSLIIVHRHLSRPLAQITEATNRVASGDKQYQIPWTKRKDEIGDMARSLVTFRENVALIDRLTADQQQQTMRLSNALEKEREYNALHREFVTMVSHEFRTPVAIIDGAAQRIERRIGKDTTDQLLERTHKIRSAVARMIELIDSTLSVSRIEAGTIELEVSECDLAALLSDICQRQQGIAKKHKINLSVADLPPRILIDGKRMDQVFTNLLSNAVKYAPNSPKIDVKAGIVGTNIVVSVRDFGLGIPQAELPKLFEKFFRASTSTGIPGTGIGLHLVKYLVELHGGSITVESTEGEGSTFSVTFPVTVPVPDAAEAGADKAAAVSA